MNKIINLKQAIELANRYNTISLEEIKKYPVISEIIKNKLTGFGRTDTCTLCISVQSKKYIEIDNILCDYCIWSFNIKSKDKMYPYCMNSISKKSYFDIGRADTHLKLYNAYRRRGKLLDEIIDKYLPEFHQEQSNQMDNN